MNFQKHWKVRRSLKIYRELAKENSQTYLPDVATSLNNLAVLHSDKNEFPEALEKYEEALKILLSNASGNSFLYECKLAKLFKLVATSGKYVCLFSLANSL